MSNLSVEQPGKSNSTAVLSPEKISLRFMAGEKRYSEAIRIYSTSDKSLKEVAEICGVKIPGLIDHIKRYHKTLFFDHYKLPSDSFPSEKIRLRQKYGQWGTTQLKYKKAITACMDIAYIEFNIYQIGRLFNLNSNSLVAQLKKYYPEIITERESIRKKLGIASRGPRSGIADKYSRAVDIYMDSDLNLVQVAKICNVSKGGFTRFMKCYHNDIVEAKENQRLSNRREKAKSATTTPDTIINTPNTTTTETFKNTYTATLYDTVANSSTTNKNSTPSHRILGL